MLLWLTAAGIGLVAAAVQYGRPAGGGWIAALLRAATIAGLVALWLDATIGRSARVRPLAALDVSASWLRGGDSAAYRSARREIQRVRADTVLLVGDSTRAGVPPTIPQDVRTRVRPAVERALAAGRPLVFVTDGEIDDPDAISELPAGSRIVVIPHARAPDGAITTVDAPRAAVAGDTIELRATVAAGSGGAPAGTVAFSFGGRPATAGTTVAIEALGARVERSVSVRAPVPSGDGPRELRAVWSAAGDADHHNDTVAVSVDVSPAAGAVFVSTSPDEDARYALGVLRGALALPTRGYFRVAPGQWRVDGTLTPVSETDVRRATAIAPLVVLQGDTAVFGPPLAATRGSLALLVPASVAPSAPASDEWYATAAPPSPIAAALSGVPWDSLPPLDVAPVAPTIGSNGWQGLQAKRGRRVDQRVVVSGGTVAGRRMVIVAASGLWRWRFRGGMSADVFAALWGGVFDWLAAERRDQRPAIPADPLVREGDPVRWRRGGSDSTVTVVLTPRNRAGHAPDSLLLSFSAGSPTSESPPLPAGEYDVRTSTGSALLVVNPSREWLPRVASVQAGAVRGVALAGAVPHLRSFAWVYVAVVLLLCVEWLWRRRIGLR